MNEQGQSLVDKLKGKKVARSFPDMLAQFQSEIARALPKHLGADRMARIALTAFRRNPKLAECDPRSVFAAVLQASQLGLEPDTLGRAYLIPYKVNLKIDNKWESHYECQFIPGWKGLVELMHRAALGSAWTGAVYAGDEFSFAMGDKPRVHHVQCGEYREESLQHVYAVGRPRGCLWPIIEVWTMDRVRAHRDRFNKVGQRHYSFENLEMYARKVVLLQVLKYMPLSADLATAMELSNSAESEGGQRLTIDAAIDGSWSPPAETEAPVGISGTDEPDVAVNKPEAPKQQPAGGKVPQRVRRDAATPYSEPKATEPIAFTAADKWPIRNEVGLWVDQTGKVFNATAYAWDAEKAKPSVDKSGAFLGRTTDPALPAEQS